ncbi:MAG: carbon-nitrogen hydrolase family protein [Phycisphaeraceae bacterium]|nr:carbon-nitrogen hydrolase family protein [Phycisphaeraceae bacterium]
MTNSSMNQQQAEPFKVATIQPFDPHSREDNGRMQAGAWDLVRRACDAGATLVVLPEYFNVMGISATAVHEVIESTGTQVELAQRICEERSVWLLLPLIEQRGERRYNCAHLFDPGGNVVHTYDKTHLTISETRDYELTAGEDITTVDTSLCRIGVMICYDIYFPEVARVLALQGVQLILFPSLQRSDVEASTMLFNRVRAMDAQSYLVRSSFGQPRGSAYKPGMMYGGSCVIAPDGSILASAGRHEGFATAVIDPHTPWQRQRCGGMGPQPVAQFLNEDRRPERYGPISRPPG